MIQPPSSEQELMQRAQTLCGKTLQQVAQSLGYSVPPSQRHAKGWVGDIMEHTLGATAASLSEPDFQALGIELKTLPIGANNQPRESTYVCTVPLQNNLNINWETSNVKRKLTKVLWVPVEADKDIPLAKRRIGKPFLWQPDPEQEAILRNDWQEIMDLICMGELDRVSSHLGKYLQVRPKAANAKALTESATESGEIGLTLPRGYYLRATFTNMLFQQYSR